MKKDSSKEPESVLQRLKSGEGEEGLKKRPDIGPRGLDSILVHRPPGMRESYDMVAQQQEMRM